MGANWISGVQLLSTIWKLAKDINFMGQAIKRENPEVMYVVRVTNHYFCTFTTGIEQKFEEKEKDRELSILTQYVITEEYLKEKR